MVDARRPRLHRALDPLRGDVAGRDRSDRRPAAGRSRGPAGGARAQPVVLRDRLHRTSSTPRRRRPAVEAALAAVDATSTSGPTALFALVLDYLREAGEAAVERPRSRRTSRATSTSATSPGLRVPRRRGLIGKVAAAGAPDEEEQRRREGTRVRLPAATAMRHRGDDRYHRTTTRANGRAAHDDCRPGRARAQPQEHLGRDPARPPRRRHRPLRVRQVQPGVRHDLRRRAAALHGVAVDVRQALRRPGRQAGRRLRLRPVAGRSRSSRRRSPTTRGRPSAR